jgi:hypothetical protein
MSSGPYKIGLSWSPGPYNTGLVWNSGPKDHPKEVHRTVAGLKKMLLFSNSNKNFIRAYF